MRTLLFLALTTLSLGQTPQLTATMVEVKGTVCSDDGAFGILHIEVKAKITNRGKQPIWIYRLFPSEASNIRVANSISDLAANKLVYEAYAGLLVPEDLMVFEVKADQFIQLRPGRSSVFVTTTWAPVALSSNLEGNFLHIQSYVFSVGARTWPYTTDTPQDIVSRLPIQPVWSTDSIRIEPFSFRVPAGTSRCEP